MSSRGWVSESWLRTNSYPSLHVCYCVWNTFVFVCRVLAALINVVPWLLKSFRNSYTWTRWCYNWDFLENTSHSRMWWRHAKYRRSFSSFCSSSTQLPFLWPVLVDVVSKHMVQTWLTMPQSWRTLATAVAWPSMVPDVNLGTPITSAPETATGSLSTTSFPVRSHSICRSSGQVKQSVETLSSTWLSAALL